MIPPDILERVTDELAAARRKFPNFHSAHEGYAVLLEECDELWDAIKHDDGDGMRREAIQVAAMALRLLTDVLAADTTRDLPF